MDDGKNYMDVEALVAHSRLRSHRAKRLLVEIANRIKSGEYEPGMRLPTERELAEQHDLSRGAARNVLAQLESAALVERVRGRGTFVKSDARVDHAGVSAHLFGICLDPEVSPAELMEARLMLEPLLPEIIVRNATTSDFSVMADCISAAQAAETIDDYEKWDGALHTAFAAATHNAFFVHLARALHSLRENGEWGRLKHRSLTEAKRSRYQEQHRRIVDALKDRDAATARLTMQEHLREVQQNLFKID